MTSEYLSWGKFFSHASGTDMDGNIGLCNTLAKTEISWQQAIKVCTDVHVPQRLNPHEFCEPQPKKYKNEKVQLD